MDFSVDRTVSDKTLYWIWQSIFLRWSSINSLDSFQIKELHDEIHFHRLSFKSMMRVLKDTFECACVKQHKPHYQVPALFLVLAERCALGLASGHYDNLFPLTWMKPFLLFLFTIQIPGNRGASINWQIVKYCCPRASHRFLSCFSHQWLETRSSLMWACALCEPRVNIILPPPLTVSITLW